VKDQIEVKHVIVTAVQHVKRMRGGAQSHLMRCSNGKFYVVKFRNNPQGPKILANEFIFSNIAAILDLSVPTAAVVGVDQWLVDQNPELNIWIPQNIPIPCESGLQYGSEYAIDPVIGRVWDWLGVETLVKVRNQAEFAGILVLDKWMCNLDSRQVVFWRRSIERKYSACFVDHGYCLGAADWEFRDAALRGAFPRNEAYRNITGWDCFDPWLSDLEDLDENLIWSAVSCTPPIWYLNDWEALEKLAETLIRRRGKVRELIEQFRDSQRHPFPNWGQTQTVWWSGADDERQMKKAAASR
jgi:hypothetical protein